MNTQSSSMLPGFETVEALEAYLTRPAPQIVTTMRHLDGDLMILGAGGKMGPTLALLAQNAVIEAGVRKRIIAVSRFTDPRVQVTLQQAGVETIACDLMDPKALQALPDVHNVIYMVGTKFGTTGQEARTWAVNAFLPGTIVQKFCHSRIVLFSSGNVYPLTPVIYGGCTEDTPPAPTGEYAQSVLGRERILTYFARQHDVPAVVLRLNYAVELRYGVLLDIARKVWVGDAIDLRMGHVNVIWQGDANAYALRSLILAERPPRVLNVTGPETLAVRSLARHFGALLSREPVFEGQEQADALLSNAQQIHKLLGYPHVSVGQMIEWVANWLMLGGPVLDKPTHFQVRDGKF